MLRRSWTHAAVALGASAVTMCRASTLKASTSVYSLSATKIDGTTLPLSTLEGKAAVVVNVASR